MKKILLVLSLVISNISFAAIANSKYEARHQSLILEAIGTNCGNLRELNQIEATEDVVVVDQGIRDVKFTTVLTGLYKIDQNVFDQYKITVESNYADMYDHSAKDWGVFSVSSVNCVME
jgi:hypothetical protein